MPALPSPLPVRALLALAFAILTWGSSFPLVRLAMQHLSALHLGALRFGLAAILSAIALVLLRDTWPARENRAGIIINGLLAMVFYTLLYNAGQATMGSGAAAFLIQIMPLFVAFIAWWYLGEKPTLGLLIGSLISLAGVGIIATARQQGLLLNWGAAMLLAAALVTAISYVLQKPLLARMKPVVLSCWLMIVGGLTFAPALPSALASVAHAPPAVWLAILYLGLVPAFMSYAAWSIALKEFSASRATNALFLVPMVASAIGYAAFDEVPVFMELIGGALVIAGVIIVNTRR